MNYFVKWMVFSTAIALASCASQKETAINPNGNIDYAYFQKWAGAQENSGSGIDFHLKFKQPLAGDSTVAKVYFRKQEAFFELAYDQQNRTAFVARFYDEPIVTASESKRADPEFPYDLKADEAILEFHSKDRKTQIKIADIKQKEAVTYP